MTAPAMQKDSAPTVLAIVKMSTEHLAKKGVESARYEAEQLVAHTLGLRRLDLYLEFDRPVTKAERDRLRAALARRAKREPLQHILGNQPFREITLSVTADTLVPRPETEEVVGWALAEGDRIAAAKKAPPKVLDLGTGSGCIAISIACERPDWSVVAVDISTAALAVAEKNAVAAQVTDRVRFAHGDLFSPVATAGPFDLIISNPPYLTPEEWAAAQPEVRDFEPEQALVGGSDGLAVYRRIFSEAPAWLASGGTVVVEIGYAQGRAVSDIARQAEFSVGIRQDMGGRDRAIIAKPQEKRQ